MMKFVICYLFLAAVLLESRQVCCKSLRNSRQIVFPENTTNANGINTASSSTTQAPTVDVNSNQYKLCIQNCGTTWQYNPVCGSDNALYHNMARLECAQRCGLNVVVLRTGIC